MDLNEEKGVSPNQENPVCSNQYCYIDGTHTDRKKIDENPEFLKNEYQSIKSNIIHIRSSQISLMTASISAAALIWGLTYNVAKENHDLLSSLFFLLPLLFLIPSLIIFFDKSISYSKLIGYMRITESMNLGFINVNYYRGYETYNKCLNCINTHFCKLGLFKLFKNYNGNKKSSQKYYDLIIKSREYRFLTVGFASYVLTLIIGYIFTIYTALGSGLFTVNIVPQLFAIFLIVTYTYTTVLLIKGHYNKLDENYWKVAYSSQNKVTIFIWIISIIFTYYFIYKTFNPEINGIFDPALFGILISTLSIVAVTFIITLILILFIVMPLYLSYNLSTYTIHYLKEKNPEERRKYFTNFTKYGIKPKKDLFQKNTMHSRSY